MTVEWASARPGGTVVARCTGDGWRSVPVETTAPKALKELVRMFTEHRDGMVLSDVATTRPTEGHTS